MNADFNTLLAEKRGFETGTPAFSESIDRAEKQLGTTFSREYRNYLLRFGYASYYGHTLTGISSYPGNDVVCVTSEARKNNPQVDDSLYVIEEAHIDGIIIWQDSNGGVYQTTPNTEPVMIATSLAEYTSK